MIDGSLPARDEVLNFESRRAHVARRLLLGGLVLLLLSAVFFLFSSRWVVVYDEGLITTGAMRVLAGQVPHRDFYFNYGAGMLYFLAGVFKLFGMSVLAERLAGTFLSSLLVISLYTMARKSCGPGIAICAGLLGFLWVASDFIQGFGPPLVCIPLLWSTWLVLPVTNAATQRSRAFGAGVLVALLFLFRYEMGIGVACAHAFAMFLFATLKEGGPKQGLRWTAREMWPYPLAVVAVLAVPAIAYLRVAPLHDLLYDVFIFQAKYYRMGRGLPLPRLTYDTLSDCVIYLPPVVIGVALYAIAREFRRNSRRSVESREFPGWVYLLVPYSVVAAVLLVKGFVRAGAGGMLPCTVCCLLTLAVLLAKRRQLGRAAQIVCVLVGVLFAVTGTAAVLQKIWFERQTNSSVLKWVVSPSTHAPFPPFRRWCSEGTPITTGFCYLLSPDHIQTIEYVRAHTRPEDTLYVGLSHHDRIFINDNITYFATQLLPATKWAHFDPFLQNRLDIQQEMIRELETNRPRYVVLDGEFGTSNEPNGSSLSTGVHLLDDYIAAHYTPVQRFGEITISRRK